jgi:hypothetical protein
MKKQIQRISHYATIAILMLTVISCKDSKKESKTELSNPFAGTWVAKNFVDSIIISRGIKTVDNGVTELIVPHSLQDSIIFLNEDLERDKYPATIKNDTLISHFDKTNAQKAVIRNGNLILLPLDERYHEQEYIKADSTLIKKAQEANVSVVRVLINKVLTDHLYATKASKNIIMFTQDGKVQGLDNLKNYHININGDEAHADDITSITVTTTNGSNKYLGIEFQKDRIDLYDLILLTKSDEKPFYKKGNLLYSLTAIQSQK